MKYPSIVRDIIDFTNDTEICNIGYNEGEIEERPYRVEEWSSYGITSATFFISSEDLTEEQAKKLIINNNLIEIIEDKIYITEVKDVEDNNFYSINVPLIGNDVEINKLLVNIKPFE